MCRRRQRRPWCHLRTRPSRLQARASASAPACRAPPEIGSRRCHRAREAETRLAARARRWVGLGANSDSVTLEWPCFFRTSRVIVACCSGVMGPSSTANGARSAGLLEGKDTCAPRPSSPEPGGAGGGAQHKPLHGAAMGDRREAAERSVPQAAQPSGPQGPRSPDLTPSSLRQATSRGSRVPGVPGCNECRRPLRAYASRRRGAGCGWRPAS